MATGFAYHDDFLLHKPSGAHPECPERLLETLKYLREIGIWSRMEMLVPEPASKEDLIRVHSKEHIENIQSLCRAASERVMYADADTYISQGTYQAAVRAAGAVKKAGEAVWTGDVDNAFALVRPPGHHAFKDKSTGFCIFDNMAVMIRYLQTEHGVGKIAVFDWDAHAPNGTMDTFKSDQSVLNISIHQDPAFFYPGTGFADETGKGEGEGYTLNIPVIQGAGDADYKHIMEEVVTPKIRSFKPEIIAVAAGADSHESDFLAALNVTDAGYVMMTRMLMDIAWEHCKGKLVVETEGGYNLESFPKTNAAVISTLLGTPPDYSVKGSVRESTKDIVNDLLRKNPN